MTIEESAVETGREGAQSELWVGVCEQGRTSASIYPVHSHQGFPKRARNREKWVEYRVGAVSM